MARTIFPFLHRKHRRPQEFLTCTKRIPCGVPLPQWEGTAAPKWPDQFYGGLLGFVIQQIICQHGMCVSNGLGLWNPEGPEIRARLALNWSSQEHSLRMPFPIVHKQTERSKHMVSGGAYKSDGVSTPPWDDSLWWESQVAPNMRCPSPGCSSSSGVSIRRIGLRG